MVSGLASIISAPLAVARGAAERGIAGLASEAHAFKGDDSELTSEVRAATVDGTVPEPGVTASLSDPAAFRGLRREETL